MNTLLRFSTVLMFVVMLIWSGCTTTKSSKTAIPNYIGQWNFSLELPDQTIKGYLTFSQEGEEVLSAIGVEEGETQLSDFTINEESFSGSFEYMGYTVDVSGDFEGNVLNGKMSAEGYEFPFEALKQQ
jgi:hypothetical protein